MRPPWIKITVLTMFILVGCNQKKDAPVKAAGSIDGVIKGGLRILSIDTDKPFTLKVYRGDYIVPEPAGLKEFVVEVPELNISRKYPVGENEKEYIKMKKTGTFSLLIGKQKGKIEVVEYTEPHYREVMAAEAKEIIENINPLILDVRTPGEYRRVHIDGAKLVPVQVLQHKLSELEPYRDKDILIYCATGNRSTVAAKILIDNGFKKIYNMRYGIAEWHNLGYPVNK